MCCIFALVLGNFLIGTTSFSGFLILIAFNPLNAVFWFRGLDNFTIFLTGCSGHGSVVFLLCNICLKAGLVSNSLRFMRLLLLVVERVSSPDAVFEVLFLQCFEVSVYVIFCVLCRSYGSCFTYAGTVMTSSVGRECIFDNFYAFCGALSFCLNYNFCGSYPLLLCFE